MTIMSDVNLENGTVNIAVFNKTDAALAALREKYLVIPDANTDEGYAFVKDGLKELTGLRTGLESVRKEVKAPYLQAGKIIDAEAQRITAALVALEDPMKAAKKEVDDRKERERLERIARLQSKVDAIKAMPGQVRGKSSAEITNMIDRVGEIDAMHDFYDLTKEAVAARQTALDDLTQMLNERLEFEATEEARQKAERESNQKAQELADQQAENQRLREELQRLQAAAAPAATAATAATAAPAPTQAAPAPTEPATAKRIAQDNRQWRAVVTDKSALIAAIAAGYGTEDLLIIDQLALDSLANDKRAALELPGVIAQPVNRAA